jgi:DNA-binding CsgD family transcriptional regulator
MSQTARWIGVLGASSSGNELCRRLATDELFGVGTVGVQLYALANSGSWLQLGSFGKVAYGVTKLTQFDESLLTLASKTRKLETTNWEVDSMPTDMSACVLLREDLPVGALVRVAIPGAYLFSPSPSALRALQDAGGLFMDSIGFRAVVSSEVAKNASPEDMTERQLAILTEMARSKTNLVISQEMMLSESTIKQESVRIFRAMGVGTRQQAVLKARALGLLAEGIEIFA